MSVFRLHCCVGG